MPAMNLSQTSSREHEIYIMKLLDDLGKFEMTSFMAFLHYVLCLVGAVPKSGSPPLPNVIQRDLQMCLESVIAAMEGKHNRSSMCSIDEALNCYCKAESELDQREGLTKAINTALLLLQPLSIGNCGAAADPHSDDFPLFIIHEIGTNVNERIPNMVCIPRKYAYQDVPELVEDVGSPPSQNNHVLEWKHLYSSWEIIHGLEPLNVTRSDYGQNYSAVPLGEYGHTVDFEDVGQVDDNPPAVKRCADNAAKVFYDTFGRNHIMNVAITDHLLCVWYFDHESPIQTASFNFLEDLPYFFLFLFALQRFSSTDWGFIDQLSPINAQVIQPLDISKEICYDDDLLSGANFRRLNDTVADCRFLSICGRATHIVFGTVTSGERNIPAVLKMCWREEGRYPEGTFLQQAVKRLHQIGCFNACDYLPTLLAEKDFPGLSTKLIRQQLMVPLKNNTTRLPYLIILPLYEPITVRTADWEAFLADYVALIYCHLILWSVGIEHGDISPSNLMWDPVSKKPKLCDFDLSHFSEDQEVVYKITGTMRFMALDLLTEKARHGKVKRQYRHDFESFVAVLVWIMFRYNNGTIHKEDALKSWRTLSASDCMDARKATYEQLRTDHTTTKAQLAHIPSHLRSALSRIVYNSHNVSTRCENLQTLHLDSEDYAYDWERENELLEDREKDLEELRTLNSTNVVLRILGFLAADSTVHPSISTTMKKMKERLSELSKAKTGLDMPTGPRNNP